MEGYIRQLIKNKVANYRGDYGEMLGDYNGEMETVEGYNGRQLLELLQNCDDEGSKEVVITLDKAKNIISIANNGKPFSKKGYRSLFIPNLSSKKSRRNYIGNKGLGFRSIINWSTTIEVQSNNIALIYSEKNRIDRFNELFSAEVQHKIRQEENFPDDVVPMPFLILPEIKKIPRSDYVTTIVINYKEKYFDSIVTQVKEITSETLLFLNHIEKVNFIGFDDVANILCHKEPLPKDPSIFGPTEKIVSGNYTWMIFEEEGGFPDDIPQAIAKEKEFYQIKIAIEKDFKKSVSRLYSFFPTNIFLNQPYVLHATFVLDSTRKQITDSDKNKHILRKIVDFTVKVAKFYSLKEVSYRPLKIVTHNQRADSLAVLGYYDMVTQAIKEQPIFPCIDNEYKALKDVIYLNEKFAKLLLKAKANKILKIHLIPFDGMDFSKTEWFDLIDYSLEVLEDPVGVVNQIAALKLDNQLRAELIAEILKSSKFFKIRFTNALNFLVDGRNKIIKGNEFIYTPATHTSDHKKLQIPTFTKIQFINRNLYNELLTVLEYSADESKNKSRFIYEQLTGFCNIHSYEPVTLAQKIISETNKVIKDDKKNGVKSVKEMNACLFNNYMLMDEETKRAILRSNAPTVTLNHQIRPAEELMLSDFYPTGKKTAVIFEGIYLKVNYVGSPKNIGLPADVDLELAESYLKWLNVNSYACYNILMANNVYSKYFEYLKRSWRDPSSTGYKMTYKAIKDFEHILERIELPRLLLWVFCDDELKTQLYDDRNRDTVYNHYYGYNLIRVKPSYLKFQIETLYQFKFNNLLIDEKYSWANDFQIDYQSNTFLKFGLLKTNINEILILLGAKEEFNQLTIGRVREIINKIPKFFPDGKKTQILYKKALNHYKEHGKKLAAPLVLFADNGKSLEPYNQDCVYFSDRIKMPKQLRKQFPVFNFPSRSGGADAIDYFGIKDLKDIKMEVIEQEFFELLSSEFDIYLTKLKPIILTRRINAIEDDSQRKIQASICNKITIKLCSQIRYAVGEEIHEVADYEFIHFADYTYYIKIKDYDKLAGLRRNTVFLDSFADIISLSFDLSSEKYDFKYLMRSSFDDILLDTKNDFGEDTYHEARELLGLADYKQAFWQAVFAAKGLFYHEQLDDLALSQLILNELAIEFDPQTIEYEGLSKDIELLKVKSLFIQLELSLQAFVAEYPYPISFEEIHYRDFKDLILSKKNDVKSMIWTSLKNSTVDQQALFLQRINQFEHFEDFARNQAELYKHQFDFDKTIILERYLSQTYVNLSRTIQGNPDLERQRNARQFTKNELYEISQSERWKSLLFFANALPVINTELKAASSEETAKPEEADQTDISQVNVLDSNALDSDNKTNNTGNKPNVFTPRDGSGRRSKEKGNKSERLVFEYLSANYDEVYPASEDNEGLHYDIRYTDKSSRVKFVEVKTFDNGSFYLSKEEYDFGRKNHADYEIWLVHRSTTLIPIFDFFTNPKYIPSPNEYLVHLKLNET